MASYCVRDGERPSEGDSIPPRDGRLGVRARPEVVVLCFTHGLFMLPARTFVVWLCDAHLTCVESRDGKGDSNDDSRPVTQNVAECTSTLVSHE